MSFDILQCREDSGMSMSGRMQKKAPRAGKLERGAKIDSRE
jgi:hypothetical protein